MLHHNTNNYNATTNEAMDSSMPGSFSQNDTNDTQFEQQGQNGLNQQQAKPSIGDPRKIQSGILNHGIPVENNNVNNKTNADNTNQLQNNQDNVNNSNTQDGHRVLESHRKGFSHNPNNNEHHCGRDAALAGGAAGAAGLAHHEYKEHENKNADHLNASRGDGLLNEHPSVPGSANNNQHHYGRDAALAGGATGAAGLAHHEYKEHENKNADPLDASRDDGLRNEDTSVPGSANNNQHHYGRDAALAGGAAGAAGLAHHEYKEHDNKNADPLNASHGDGFRNEHSSVPESANNNQQHYGGDVALAGGAAGTTGLAHHEYKEHENKNADPLDASRGDGLRNEHSSVPGSANNNQHHYGRDAALTGGAAGAAGLAHHEYKEHHKNDAQRDGTNPLRNEHSSAPGSANNNQHHYGRDAALAGGAAGATGLTHHEYKEHENKNADPLSASRGDGFRNEHSSVPGSANNNQHHYGRDAALAGGAAGAAGLAHHEYKEHENKNADPLDASRGDGLRNEDTSVPGSANNNQHHYGRDAALAGGAAGAAGLAHHEYKEHENKNTDPLNASHGDGLRNEHSSFPGSANNNQHHYGRDSALAGGAAGAAGLAHHEHKEHENKNADHLNASRGDDLLNEHPSVPGSANNNQHHYGRDAALAGGAAGAAGLAHHEYKEHENKNADPLDASRGDGLRNEDTSVPGSANNNQHHYGRDAALAGGAAGAAGLAHHEYKEHENKNADPLNASHGDGLRNEHSSFPGSANNNQHHYGRDAALAGGAAGAAGLAHHEHKEHEAKKDAATSSEGEENATAGAEGEKAKKPLNSGGDVHHIAEQPMITQHGGLTGNQPVGEVSFKKL